jgi:alpha-ketoglutarate-dependent taurine dioxygenase
VTKSELDGVRATPYAPGQGLPLFIEPEHARLAGNLDYALDWFVTNRPEIDRLTTDVGAMVLRGFPFRNASDLDRLVSPYKSPDFGYTAGATPRGKIEGRVFEATAAPPDVTIGLHQEMSYLPHYPSRLAFFCVQPAEEGGETAIADMRRFDAALRPGFREAVREMGVLYRRYFREADCSTGDPRYDVVYRTWQDGMRVDSRRAAEEACVAMGLDWEWGDGYFCVKYHSPGFARHPQTGREIWFNQIATMSPTRRRAPPRFSSDRLPPSYVTTFGNGSEFEVDDIENAIALFNELSVAFPWRAGDVMLLDNFNTAHGRMPFRGKREIQVALLAD